MLITKMKLHVVMRRLISTTEHDILFKCLNNAGVVTFNRPAKLNSLTPPMISTLLSRLQEWEKSKLMVIFKGAGDKAFSPGGDINLASNKIMGPTMFNAQYNVIFCLHKYNLPCISLINGIAMGGALALSVFGKYSVATEKTVVAMPETKIGLIPDAGGSYFLPRLQFNLGRYLGLTGKSVKNSIWSYICYWLCKWFNSSHFYSLKNMLLFVKQEVYLKKYLLKYRLYFIS